LDLSLQSLRFAVCRFYKRRTGNLTGVTMNKPTIFLIEEDNLVRPLLKETLNERGYKVIVSVDEEDAFQRTNDGLLKADLILIDLLNKSAKDVLSVGQQLRQESNPNIPIVGIATKYDADMKGGILRADEKSYIVYLSEDANEFFDLLADLTKS
jgi:CheY-like chemotaxis protein